MCHAREPIFSPKFPLQSIYSFSQMKKKIEHDHLKNLFTFKRKPFIATHGRLTAAASPNTKRSGSAPGLLAGKSASQTHPTDPHFHARLAPEPPIFHFAMAHTFFGGSAPPPPRPRSHSLSAFGCLILLSSTFISSPNFSILSITMQCHVKNLKKEGRRNGSHAGGKGGANKEN